MKIGIDLGGTKTEGILINKDGQELKRKRIKTEKNYKGSINGIISIVEEFESNFGDSESIGIGMPGAVSADSAHPKLSIATQTPVLDFAASIQGNSSSTSKHTKGQTCNYTPQYW